MSMRWRMMRPTSFERAASTLVLKSTSALSGVMEVMGLLRLDSGPLRELVTEVTEQRERERGGGEEEE